MLPVDFYFRYALADNAKQPIADARKNKKVDSKILYEFEIYHRRYPMLAVTATRGLLVVTAFIFLLLSKSANGVETIVYEGFSCVTLCLCIIINETFSWGYRLKLIRRSGIYEDINKQRDA